MNAPIVKALFTLYFKLLSDPKKLGSNLKRAFLINPDKKNQAFYTVLNKPTVSPNNTDHFYAIN